MTTTVTIVRDSHGDEEAHAAGCAHLRRRAYQARMADAYDIEVSSVDDITFEVFGASGVATDYCRDAIDSPEYRAFTIAEYSGLVHILPCVKL